MTICSRRDLVRSSGSLFGMLFARRFAAAHAPPEDLKISLAHEFQAARVLAVSPDGTKLCLEDWRIRGYPFRVVEVGTWRTVYSGGFQQKALAVGFFADGQALFLDFAGGKGQLDHRQAVVDIRNGERTERMHAYDPFHYFEQMSPLTDRTLLVAHYGDKPHSAMEWLSRVEFPSYKELKRIQLPDHQNDSRVSTGVQVSDDRKVAAYFFNNAVVCRQTQDLGVRWAHPIEAGLSAYPFVVSAHGDYVAASIARGTSDGQFYHYTYMYICVYDGRTGGELARLPLSGANGIALSPDGKLLAVVASEPGQKGEIHPTVHIYEVSSGARLASVVHDRIPSGRRQFLLSGCSVAFTSDAKYLVTSGMVTRVWRIGA